MKIKISILSLILITGTAFSQWNQNPAINNTICVQPYNQINVKLIPDLKGGAIMVWQDFRNDPTNSAADIYAQRINNVGNVMWQTNGIAICTDISNQTAPTIITDSAGGAIIVWQDYRNPNRNLYAQRVDSLGNIKWAANGVGVTLRNFDQQNPKILNDGANGAIVIWQDSVGGSYDIYGQHLNQNGTALWLNGVGICSLPFSQINPKAQINSGGEIYVTWQDKRNGSNYDIFAQKLNLAGVAQWAANGIAITNIIGNQTNPKISIDAGGQAIITWQDKRGGIDYDIFAQRLNSFGAIQWANNGVAISNTIGSQTAVDITTQNISNGAIIAWKDARAGVNNIDVYAQMINLSGTVQWAANGLAVANANFNQLAPNVITDGVGGAIISYQDSSGGNWDIRSQRISQAGALLWPVGGDSVGIAGGHQTNQSNIYVGNGKSIYAFEDTRSGNSDIYAYRIDNSSAYVGIVPVTGTKFTINVFPNPSNGKVTFTFSNSTEAWKINITDINGKDIYYEEVNKEDSITLAGKLESGIYFYRIQSSSTSVNGKFVILN